MTKPNDENSWEVEITVGQARAMLDLELPDSIAEPLDMAQGYAFSGDGDGFLIIKIRG